MSGVERRLAQRWVGRAASGCAAYPASPPTAWSLLPGFPSTHALFGDWYNHALFATVFLFGFLLAHADGVWEAVERLRWVALVARGRGLSSRFFALWATRSRDAAANSGGIAYGSYQWLCMVAVLGFARRWFNLNRAVRRYLTDAIFPYYIVHQTAIIMIAHAFHACACQLAVEAGASSLLGPPRPACDL